VISAARHEPVAGAAITWTASGGRVEAIASATGEALLEGVGTAGGTLAITARGYVRVEENLSEPPAVLYDILLRSAPITTLQARVISASGEPVPNAVVALWPRNPMDVPHVAATDAKGDVAFADVPLGALDLEASADAFNTAVMRIPDDSRVPVVLTLSQTTMKQ
jgi:hypothetical protein